MGKASAAKAARRALLEEQAADPREFWHGGASGLAPGTMLLPGEQVPGYSDLLKRAPQEMVAVLAPNWVYVTTDRDLAIDYAAQQGSLFGSGALYLVRPVGLLAPDPDYAHVDGISYRLKRAEIIRLEREFDGTDSYSPTGAALRYATWDDATQMYDSHGFPLPNATQRELGVTPGDLRSLGRGAPFEAINRHAGKIVGERNPGITQAVVDGIRAKHRSRAVGPAKG
jgi:hypothetical protein